jgi:hypothetical protein
MSNQDYRATPPPVYAQETSSLAIVSLVAGIISYFFLPVIGAITAIITGGIAKRQIRESNGRLSGRGMATWGVVLGWINIGLGLLVACVIMLLVLGVGGFAFSLPFLNQ